MRVHLRAVRKMHGVSIRRLSALTGISKSHIVRIENGESIPTVATLCKIANALHVYPGVLYSCGNKYERSGEMLNREEIIAEVYEIAERLSMLELLRLLDCARALHKKELRHKQEG